MQDIEKLKADHAADLENALLANSIEALLPDPPRAVAVINSAYISVGYTVQSLQDAVDLFMKFTPEPWVIAKTDGCTVLNTWAHIDKVYNVAHPAKTNYRPAEIEHTMSDGVPYFSCRQGVGYGYSKMEFFVTLAGRCVKVSISVLACPIHVLLRVYDSSSRNPDNKYGKEYPRVPHAERIDWGTGSNCCSATYWYKDMATFWLSMESFGVHPPTPKVQVDK